MSKAVIIPILNTEYKVVVCWGDNKFIAKTLRRFHHTGWNIDNIAEGMSNVRGMIFYCPLSYCVIAFRQYPKTPEQIGTLAHEATHAVEYTLQYIHESSRDEVFAHSVGAIVRETLRH